MIGLEVIRIRSDRVRSYRVRIDRVRNYRDRNDWVRNDRELEMTVNHFLHTLCL